MKTIINYLEPNGSWAAPIMLDTNRNGKRDAWAEPNQPLDPAKDKRLNFGVYGIGYDPTDGSLWGAVLSFPGPQFENVSEAGAVQSSYLGRPV